MTFCSKPIQGVGIGLRTQHLETILTELPDVPWFEAISENYMHQGHRAHYHLDKIRQHYPVTLHGVSMSIGSSDPLNMEYLASLKALCDWVQPAWVSDHLCWSSLNKQYVPDLLPLPYTEEAINHVVAKITQVQDYLGRRILIENVSSYLTYNFSELEEWEFVTEIVNRADCNLLLDINNIYVSAKNHNFDPFTYINAIPFDKVKEMHLAGYLDQGTHLLDTHGCKIHQPVWDLYATAIKKLPEVPTLIEWDTDIPAFEVLLEEKQKADEIQKAYEPA